MAEPLESDFEPTRLREGRQPASPRILWGRVVTLTLVLTLSFVLGRASAPDIPPTDQRINDLRVELSDAREEIDRLQSQLASSPVPSPSPATSPTAAQTSTQTYTVQDGDTLGSIALKFYGDSSLASYLADANGITDSRKLRPGMKLQIPPKPKT